MTTRVDIAGRVRAELGDPGPQFVWSNELLYRWLGEGLTRLSSDMPSLRNVALTVFTGATQYPLFGLAIGPRGVQAVEYPDGHKLPMGETRQQNEGYGLLSIQPFENCWELVRRTGGSYELWLRYPVSGSQSYITVWAYSVYAIPVSDSDTLEVYGFDEELLIWWICGRAVRWLAQQRGKRSALAQAWDAGYYEWLYSSGMVARRRSIKAGTLKPEV